jgi:NAD(P)H-flavin reductase
MKIISKEILSDTPNSRVIRLDILAPDIARRVSPGQFVALMVAEVGERRRLAIIQ